MARHSAFIAMKSDAAQLRRCVEKRQQQQQPSVRLNGTNAAAPFSDGKSVKEETKGGFIDGRGLLRQVDDGRARYERASAILHVHLRASGRSSRTGGRVGGRPAPIPRFPRP